ATGTQARAEPASQPNTPTDVGWNYLGGGDSSQYSPLDQINTSNVKDLRPEWVFEAGVDPPYAFGFRFSPTIIGDKVFVMADGNALVALNAATGKEIWRHKFEGPIGQRGITYWQSKDGKDTRLFVNNAAHLRAINADTGEIIEEFGGKDGVDLRVGLSRKDALEKPMRQTDNPGRVFEDEIIFSLPAAYDYDVAPADIHAYDVHTGALKWVFHVVPEKGEFGYDTWPKKDHERFGGGHNWSESTIDTEAGIIYIPTGSPRFDWYGGNRPGNNLFGNTLLALDARTGKRLWHFQAVHHDLWDFDLPTSPKLMTITHDGKEVPIVIQATKMGWLLVFDRRTGEPIWPIIERPVPKSDVPGERASPTQPFPTWPPPYARQRFTEEDINPYLPDADKEKLRQLLRESRNEGIFTPQSLRGTIMMPSENGGSNFGMVAIDPVKRRLYIVVRNYPSYIKLIPEKRPLSEMPNSGGNVKPYNGRFDFLLQSNGMVAIGPPWSTITAYDMNSGAMLYQVPNGDMAVLGDKGKGLGSQTPRGGPVVTAGGLLFDGTSSDRKFRARDAANGQILWEYQAPAASEGTPAVYQVGGREYIVIPCGWEGMFNGRLGLPPAPKTNRYIAFALPKGKK
ncbi:MAG TPA: PQQ-binding-like beta-propeller repeat protein, partial [Alphaproteobacteria bacterium]|nr:PQQ-binding-like beta-propeller repeat protein [Alphaproteobacteria bacterium]